MDMKHMQKWDKPVTPWGKKIASFIEEAINLPVSDEQLNDIYTIVKAERQWWRCTPSFREYRAIKILYRNLINSLDNNTKEN